MPVIGIATEILNSKTFDVLTELLETYFTDEAIEKPTLFLLGEKADIPQDLTLDILITEEKTKNRQKYANMLRDGGIFLLNADEKNNFSGLKLKNIALITYGFNNKSCVTASSVTDGVIQTVQCCIQRELPTLSGKKIFPQEFSVSIKSADAQSQNILAAATALIACDLVFQ